VGEHRRGHGGLYGALADSRVDVARLRPDAHTSPQPRPPHLPMPSASPPRSASSRIIRCSASCRSKVCWIAAAVSCTSGSDGTSVGASPNSHTRGRRRGHAFRIPDRVPGPRSAQGSALAGCCHRRSLSSAPGPRAGGEDTDPYTGPGRRRGAWDAYRGRSRNPHLRLPALEVWTTSAPGSEDAPLVVELVGASRPAHGRVGSRVARGHRTLAIATRGCCRSCRRRRRAW
jgi:hypothetical protein